LERKHPRRQTFVLQFKIANNTDTELTAQARPVPAVFGISGLTAAVLPAAAWSRPDLDLSAAAASPLTVPRGGYAVYALAGAVTCFRYGPDPAGTAPLILNKQAADLPLPKVDDKPYPDYLVRQPPFVIMVARHPGSSRIRCATRVEGDLCR
jgi:hypothetical protein